MSPDSKPTDVSKRKPKDRAEAKARISRRWPHISPFTLSACMEAVVNCSEEEDEDGTCPCARFIADRLEAYAPARELVLIEAAKAMCSFCAGTTPTHDPDGRLLFGPNRVGVYQHRARHTAGTVYAGVVCRASAIHQLIGKTHDGTRFK